MEDEVRNDEKKVAIKDGWNVIKLEKISKSFGGTMALKAVDFSVKRGEIHALLGKNGAGKSTLVKVLMGVVTPDTGTISIGGKRVILRDPRAAQEFGISMVFQELALFSNLSVAENIMMGRFPRRWDRRIDWRETNLRAAAILNKMGFPIDPGTPLTRLALGQRQLVEIAKAISFEPMVLILDEPTSALSFTEQEVLFNILRGLKEQGLAVIFITHRIKEVFALSDRFTVLRDGECVLTGKTTETGEADLLEAIVGTKASIKPAVRSRVVGPAGNSLFEVRNLSLGRYFKHISFTLHQGEILGIVGMVGSGKTELAKALFGLPPHPTGEIWMENRPILPTSPEAALKLGMGLVPEDRKEDGLVPRMGMAANITLASMDRFRGRFFLDRARELEIVAPIVRFTEITPDNPHLPADSFSGGNQQKIMLSRWLARGVKVLILDEPTRGVDVGAKRKIYDLLRTLAAEGLGIIILSSEFEEVHPEVNRLLVLSRGRIVMEADPQRTPWENILSSALRGD